MRLLRHARVRYSILRVFRRPATPPTYPNPEVDNDNDDEPLRACETFMGARGGNADQREAYRARAMEYLISDPSVPEDRKELLRAARAKRNLCIAMNALCIFNFFQVCRAKRGVLKRTAKRSMPTEHSRCQCDCRAGLGTRSLSVWLGQGKCRWLHPRNRSDLQERRSVISSLHRCSGSALPQCVGQRDVSSKAERPDIALQAHTHQ